jgi:hypothetical protein
MPAPINHTCDLCAEYEYRSYPGSVHGHDVRLVSICRIGGKRVREQRICSSHRKGLKSEGYRVTEIG